MKARIETERKMEHLPIESGRTEKIEEVEKERTAEEGEEDEEARGRKESEEENKKDSFFVGVAVVVVVADVVASFLPSFRSLCTEEETKGR